MRADIVAGAVFPDHELTDHRARRRKLSELQGDDPLVLALARGGYCPRDRRQHEGLLQLHREAEVGFCRLVTILTESLAQTVEFRSGVGAHWTFLSDPARKLQKDLDIAEYTDPQHDPMIPHTLVLEPGLPIWKVYDGYWFFGRPTVEELRIDPRAVLKRCRPDWRPGTGERRVRWARGDKAGFHPYGKTQAELLASGEDRTPAVRGDHMDRQTLYFDDLKVGDKFESAITHTVTADDIRQFAAEFDPQPFHLDEGAARNTMFHGLAASGWHTAAITMRLLVTSGPKLANGIVGMGGEIAWPAPTRPGDVLRLESEVVESVPSKSRPDRGVVRLRTRTLNQRGEVVYEQTARLMVARRAT